MDAFTLERYLAVKNPAAALRPAQGDDFTEALLAGLNGLAHGVALFDAAGDPRYANAAARGKLASLGGSGDNAAHSTCEHQRRWSDALRRVCKLGRRELFALPGGSNAGFVALVPITIQGRSFAFATFGRDELCGAIELQMFNHSHGLTLTEGQVLRQLCAGLKAAAIARANGVSISTVLTHITAIRNKTLFSSVRDLLGALSRMPPLTPISAMRDGL